MSNHVAAQLMTLDTRSAIHSDSKVPSCGNQPAHIRLDTRRHDTLDASAELTRSTKRRSRRRLRPPLHPAHLTEPSPYQSAASLRADGLSLICIDCPTAADPPVRHGHRQLDNIAGLVHHAGV